MFGNRSTVLGQVAITAQAGFGGAPWSLSTPLSPRAGFPAPYGAPLVTEENTASWMCPDGVTRVLTVAQARAMGCTRKTLGVGLDDLVDVVTQGAETYQSYADKEAAEAKAAAAQAEAARAAAAAAAAAAGRTVPQGKILGIPTNYLLYGGIGLAAIAAVIAVTKK